jgi:hypothetical protein
MRLYIGQGLTKRQGWIFNLLQDGKTIPEIHKASRTGYSRREIEEEVQEVLDITDFCGKAHPNSYVMTTHAYHRLFERYDGLLGYEIEAMIEDMRCNGRLFKKEDDGTVKIVHKDIIWVMKGNKIITVYWDEKAMKRKIARSL